MRRALFALAPIIAIAIAVIVLTWSSGANTNTTEAATVGAAMSMSIPGGQTVPCPVTKVSGETCIGLNAKFDVAVSADAIPAGGYLAAQAWIQYGATGLVGKGATMLWPDGDVATFFPFDTGTGASAGALTDLFSPFPSFHKGAIFSFSFTCTPAASQHTMVLEPVGGPNAGTSGSGYIDAGSATIPATGPNLLVNCVGPQGTDDKFFSMGKFEIAVSPEFRALMVGYPGYEEATGKLTSPRLLDFSTVVGVSVAHVDGDADDTNGVPVGTAGTIVADSDFSVLPAFEGPTGTGEVHTEIREMDLAAGPVHVRAGIDAPDQPISPGEVESQSVTGNPILQFPADSFFNVFVEVDLPGAFNFPGGTLFNSSALLVVSTNVILLPPKVVYVHGNSFAVRVFFKFDNMPEWQAGDLFGWLQLAGHGAGFNDTPEDRDEFDTIFDEEVASDPLPIPDTDGGGAPDDLEIAKSGDLGNSADDAAILALDNDGDGCTNGQELGSILANGGLRDYLNPWDWYDTDGDGDIDLFGDILGVIGHYSLDGLDPYDVIFDRGPSAGPNPWNMTAPDGVINLFTDILGVIGQYTLTGCT